MITVTIEARDSDTIIDSYGHLREPIGSMIEVALQFHSQSQESETVTSKQRNLEVTIESKDTE